MAVVAHEHEAEALAAARLVAADEFAERAELDALLESGRYEQNRTQRREIYQQVQRMLAEALPHLPLWHENKLALVSRRVSGYRFHPAGDFHALRTLRVN